MIFFRFQYEHVGVGAGRLFLRRLLRWGVDRGSEVFLRFAAGLPLEGRLRLRCRLWLRLWRRVGLRRRVRRVDDRVKQVAEVVVVGRGRRRRLYDGRLGLEVVLEVVSI